MQAPSQTSATTVDELWDCFEVLKTQVDLMATEHGVSKALMFAMLKDYASRQLLDQVGQ